MLDDLAVEFSGKIFTCVDRGFGQSVPVDVVIRPEDLKIVPEEGAMLQGTVQSIVFKGVHYEMVIVSDEDTAGSFTPPCASPSAQGWE
jgi:spermidine/putrescine transport system ATP-binding protein